MSKPQIQIITHRGRNIARKMARIEADGDEVFIYMIHDIPGSDDKRYWFRR